MPLIFEKLFPLNGKFFILSKNLIADLQWFRYFQMFKEFNFEKHMGEVEIEWANIVSLMSQILDTDREESLINVCNDPEKYVKQRLAKQPLRVPIHLILPERSVKMIDQ